MTQSTTTLDIYTDGACNPNPGVGGWGIVAYQDGKEVWTESGGDMETTNNRMELTAIIMALRLAAGRPCFIFSDSQLCINTLTSWARAWERRGWQKSSSGEIKNLDLVKTAWALVQQSRAKLVWVKGHAGNRGNERADRLANEGRNGVINSRIKEAA